jgi:hypothetical protein
LESTGEAEGISVDILEILEWGLGLLGMLGMLGTLVLVRYYNA